jgi:hypothetical protein
VGFAFIRVVRYPWSNARAPGHRRFVRGVQVTGAGGEGAARVDGVERDGECGGIDRGAAVEGGRAGRGRDAGQAAP